MLNGRGTEEDVKNSLERERKTKEIKQKQKEGKMKGTEGTWNP